KPIEITTDHEFTVVATANMAQTAECTYKITVGLAFDKNVVLIDGQVGVEYSADIKAAGARNVIHTIKEGTLPEGVVMNNDGSFSGTPTKAGVYTFTVQAEKDGCLGDEIEVTIYIANGAAGGCVGNVETSSVIVISALGLTALALVKRTLNKKRKGDL
ncbi:MAG: putative Ig domain-containing protein, partial [Clostridia bacterium]|nr:putative Ig domain-containing protein [Clostridia bacterium]